MTLEKLFSTLCERWWKPFGDYDIAEFNQIWKEIGQPKLRQIVSIESGLWQFCVENEMINEKKKNHKRMKDVMRWEWWIDCEKEAPAWDYEYRLIESALKNEDELEEFLLDNIKVE